MAAFAPKGKVTVTTAGTRVQLVSSSTPCSAISIQALASNGGKIYIGGSTVVGTTLVGVGHVLAIPSGAAIPSWSAGVSSKAYTFDASEIWLDSDSNGDGVVWAVIAP